MGMDKYNELLNRPPSYGEPDNLLKGRINRVPNQRIVHVEKIAQEGIKKKKKARDRSLILKERLSEPKDCLVRVVGNYRTQYPQSHGPFIHGMEKRGVYVPSDSPVMSLNTVSALRATKTIVKSCLEHKGVFIHKRVTHFEDIGRLLNLVLTKDIRFRDVAKEVTYGVSEKHDKLIGYRRLVGYSAQEVLLGVGTAHAEWVLDFMCPGSLLMKRASSYGLANLNLGVESSVMLFLYVIAYEDWLVFELMRKGLVTED
jgi:hypothetical protein